MYVHHVPKCMSCHKTNAVITRKAKKENVNLATQVNHHCVASRLLTLVHSKVTKLWNVLVSIQQLYTIVHKLNCKSKFTIYLMGRALCKILYVGKAETAFNIRLNNHRKDANNPKSIPADFHFRKPGHSFNLHAKFTLIEQLSNIHTTDKETLKFRLKRREDFWIQKLETLTPKGLNQKLNNG